MGFFDEQVRKRRKNDDDMFIGAYKRLSEVVGGTGVWQDFENLETLTHSVAEELALYLNVKLPNTTTQEMSVEQYLEDVFRPQGIMWRSVRLKDSWFRSSVGVMLGTLKDGRHTILVPSSGNGYTYRNPDTGKRERITKETAAKLSDSALLMYRSLPLRKINNTDIRNFIQKSLSFKDIFIYALATFAIMLISMIIPVATETLISTQRNIIGIFIIMALTIASGFMITLIRALMLPRIMTEAAVPLQAAFMMRLLTAPMDKIRGFAAGDLGQRIGTMYDNLRILFSMVLSLLLTAACSLVCFIQMFIISPALGGIALGLVLILFILYYRVIIRQADVSLKRMNAKAEEAGLTYNLIDNVQKITVTGSEKRAFSAWADIYRDSVSSLYNPPLFVKVFPILTPTLLLASNILMFIVAANTQTTQSTFYAFTASFAIVSGALAVIPENTLSFANVIPMFDILRPLMDIEPEIDGAKELPVRLKGNIHLQNITFGYIKDMPPVIQDLSMKINAGEYVAIVGATGCGKSTIMKLLLGFERPETGEIYYDKSALSSLNVSALRKQIGTVLQNAEVLQGTIFENITVSGKNLTMEDAWWAAELAGIADDIRKMPLEMNTPLSAGGRGVSGGQKQRLMIARAIVTKPKILIFDEATSALDNITQKAIFDAIDQMKCTRIVIAHRLSAVQSCDRIFCMNHGTIVEQGTYDELIELDGYFAQLVKKQMI